MSKRCLIIDEMHSSIMPMLKQIGIEPDYRPDIKKEEIISVVEHFEGIIVRSKIYIGKEILEKATRLKYIARAGAGMDMIDVAEANKRNIKLYNAPEGNRDALAEHTVAMLLTLLNKIHISDKQVRKGLWDREGNRGFELKGKCVAIIGYGYMGKAVARRLKAFGCEVLAYDKLKGVSDEYVKESGMEEIFDSADIISFHIPLTDETKGLVDSNYLARFKKNIWLVNTARGEILKLRSLIDSLESGQVRGAALDVLENEKITSFTEEQRKDFNYLINSDKVLLTPHVGGWTFESYVKINETLVEKIKEANG